MVLQPMFDDIPTDASPEYLSGLAGFIASEGDRTEGTGKNDYIYALNQMVGVERIPADTDGRASQKVVAADEVPDDTEPLTQGDYTNNVFEAEVQAWATELLSRVNADEDSE